MSNKLTAEEYLDTQLALGWDYIDIETAETYGDLRAKEAVEKFARELIAQSETWQNQSGEVDDVGKRGEREKPFSLWGRTYLSDFNFAELLRLSSMLCILSCIFIIVSSFLSDSHFCQVDNIVKNIVTGIAYLFITLNAVLFFCALIRLQ